MLSVRLEVNMLKARIAHDFDEQSMLQDIVIEPASHMDIRSFSFTVHHGPGTSLPAPSPDIEEAADQYTSQADHVQGPEEPPIHNEMGRRLYVPSVPTATSLPRDKRVDWILIVLILLLVVEIAK
jgi:hypothetical protein